MGEKGFNTNLAAEYYVLSMLHRLGANAFLTIGNKKAVDIVIDKNGKTIAIDVKGIRDKTGFGMDNWTKKNRNHYIVFVSFLRKIDNPMVMPEVYIIPSTEIDKQRSVLDGNSLIYKNPKGNRTTVEYSRLRKLRDKYLNNGSVFYSNQHCVWSFDNKEYHL